MTQKFWKPKPVEPWSDWRTHSMLLPILVSAVGFFVTGIFAFAFGDIQVIPETVQSWLVVVGSGLIVFGAELNTPFTTIEVFRKILRHEHNEWDLSALVASLVGTLINLIVVFSTRLPIEAAWRMLARNWGPLISGIAVACDYYGSMIELGFLFGSFDERYEQWRQEEAEWNQEHGIVAPVDRSTWRTATVNDFRVLVTSLNGARATLTADNLQGFFDAMQLRLDASDTTVRRWLKMEAE